MVSLLWIAVVAGALLALVGGILALRAGLRLRRTRLALQSDLADEVTRLAGRATELEKSLAALDARAGALPVRISEMQQNLVTLRILTTALAGSLRQAQRVLTSVGLKSSLAKPLAELSRNLRG